MIFLGKHRRITVLCIVVGRIKIKKCVWPVVLVDDFYAVLVFDDDICQPAGALPNQIEETADIAGFSGKGLGAAAEAVSNQLEKVGSAPYITARRSFQHHSLDGLSVRKLQIPLRQLQLLFQIVIGEFLFGEELIQHIEIVACIQRQKPQLQQERHGPVFDTTEQVGQVAVEVVVDLYTSRLDGAAQGYCAAAAEHINKTGIPRGRQLSDQPQQLAFTAHPGDEAFQAVSPPSSGRDICPLSVDCSSALVRPRSAWAIFLIRLRSCRMVLCSSSSVPA